MHATYAIDFDKVDGQPLFHEQLSDAEAVSCP
jgi:hypothetical protein